MSNGANQEILDYIKDARGHGLTDSEIKQNLLGAAWELSTIEEAFAAAKVEQSSPAVLGNLGNQNAVSRPQLEHKSPAQPLITQAVIAPVLSDTQLSQPTAAPKKSKKLAISAIVVTIIVLGGAAYAYFVYGFNAPAKVWQKFVVGTKSNIYKNTFSFTYSDPGTLDDTSGMLNLNLKDIKVKFSGNAYLNASDVNNPQSSSELQYTFSSGNTSFSTGIKYILLDKSFYLNIGTNPFLDLLFNAISGGKKYDWLKINFDEAKSKLSDSQQSDYKEFNELLSPTFKTELEKIWDGATIVKEDKFLGREKVNGVNTMHFQNSIDKAALKSLFEQYVEKLAKVFESSQTPISAQDIETANEVASQLIDKLQVKQFETWVGITDFKLYRVRFVTNAPSFISLAKNADSLNSPAHLDSDSQRLADIRQLASALELYYNDYNGYPEASASSGFAPNYIGTIPTAPTPAEGSCTEKYNKYQYKPLGTSIISKGKTVYSSYELTFCLGAPTGGYEAGIGKLSPMGIVANIPCPTTAEECVNSAAKPATMSDETKKQITDFISKLDFSAEISADVDYSDYGKVNNLTAPTEYLDILKILEDAQAKSRDAKRLADVRQYASAFELYYNDKNQYPPKIEGITPLYMGQLATSPEPTDGSCSAEENTYTYKLTDPQNYKLTFCLGSDTGGYSAGLHTLSPAGIQ